MCSRRNGSVCVFVPEFRAIRYGRPTRGTNVCAAPLQIPRGSSPGRSFSAGEPSFNSSRVLPRVNEVQCVPFSSSCASRLRMRRRFRITPSPRWFALLGLCVSVDCLLELHLKGEISLQMIPPAPVGSLACLSILRTLTPITLCF